ncbi:MAG: hypothetical protein QOA16_03085 [Nitrososphaeraceae archaeon]|nr:hypothetical protein [Nitrososphaeraceae archaeon]
MERWQLATNVVASEKLWHNTQGIWRIIHLVLPFCYAKIVQ